MNDAPLVAMSVSIAIAIASLAGLLIAWIVLKRDR